MKSTRRIAGMMMGALCAAAMPAHAELTIANEVLQSGMFAKAECTPEGIEGFNECVCVADVHYPVLGGLDPEKLKPLNAAFVTMAEKQKCEGKETQTESKDEPASSTFNFETTYQTPAMLGLRFESWSYTGGAHGNGAVGGVIIDLAQGRVLTLTDVFGKKGLPGVNKFIYDALSAEPEGEVFHDSIEAFNKQFVTETECKSCTVVLAADGLKVVFQTYAVASFANGPMEVMIPAQYIADPLVKDAVVNPKPQPVSQADAPLTTMEEPAGEIAPEASVEPAPSAAAETAVKKASPLPDPKPITPSE